MQKGARQKWQIIKLGAIQNGEIRAIKFKVDDSIRHCRGFIFSCNEPGFSRFNFVMGDLSLLINTRKSHPLHYTMRSLPHGLSRRPTDPVFKRKVIPLKLDECIEGGSFIHGYYMDLGKSSAYPYTLRIYLDCIANG